KDILTQERVQEYLEDPVFLGTENYSSVYHRYLTRASEAITIELEANRTLTPTRIPSPEHNFFTAREEVAEGSRAPRYQAQSTSPKGDLDIQKFDGKTKDVIPFISNVETAYKANGWTDKRNPDKLLENNVYSDKEELFSKASAQVNKVALHFRGTAALWWQNL